MLKGSLLEEKYLQIGPNVANSSGGRLLVNAKTTIQSVISNDFPLATIVRTNVCRETGTSQKITMMMKMAAILLEIPFVNNEVAM
mmetsp:Transcript_14841/g.21902  ORF Transcript_14841/g.21902 Transcript_14841/m.21902 type:complete len:85 (-) Transcript_14841:1176-1430(-)